LIEKSRLIPNFLFAQQVNSTKHRENSSFISHLNEIISHVGETDISPKEPEKESIFEGIHSDEKFGRIMFLTIRDFYDAT
jgi:hypothetical protein